MDLPLTTYIGPKNTLPCMRGSHSVEYDALSQEETLGIGPLTQEYYWL